jgi:hypothetical protein
LVCEKITDYTESTFQGSAEVTFRCKADLEHYFLLRSLKHFQSHVKLHTTVTPTFLSYKTWDMLDTYVSAHFGSVSCLLVRIGLLLCLLLYWSVEFLHNTCPYATR